MERHPSDKELDTPELYLLKGGKEDWLEDLFRSCYQSSLALALRLVGNIEDARDVIQDSYVKASKGFENFRGDSSIETWFNRIVINTAKTFRLGRSKRSARENVQLLDEKDFPTSGGDDSLASVVIDIERAMAKLPPRFKSVLVFRDFYGMSHREIAERLSITEATAKVWLHRAHKKIADILTLEKGLIEGVYGGLRKSEGERRAG